MSVPSNPPLQRSIRQVFSGAGGIALAVLLLSGAGCRYQKPKFDVDERVILIVPFRDFTAVNRTGYGESPLGQKIVDAFRTWSESNADPYFSDEADQDSVVKALREWTKSKITTTDWKQLCGGTDADLVLIGEIKEMELRDPKTIGMFKGTIKGKYTLIDARTGLPAYKSPDYSLEYPKGTELDSPIPDISAKPKDIERGLIREFGERIGKDLYGYYEDRRYLNP